MTNLPRCDCGSALQPNLDWCPRCHTPRTPTANPQDQPAERPAWPSAPRRRASTLGRWDASVITFSLRGRIIATILFTLPLLWFLYYLVPFGFVGLVTYGAVYPRAMRDIWTRADRL